MANEKREGRQFPFEMTVRHGEGRLVPTFLREGWMSFVGVLSGKVQIQAGLFSREASENEILFVAPSRLLSCEAADGPAKIRLMTFHESILSQNMDTIESELLYMLTVQAKNLLFTFTEEHPLHAKLTALMDAAQDEYEAHEVCYAMPIRANLYLMMTELLRHYGGEKRGDDRMVYHNVMRMKPVLDRIESDYAGKITIPSLAAELCLTPDHFTRIFREGVGVPPVEYINRVRLHNALALLAETNLPVSEVAQRSGFFSMQYFYRIFRETLGNSPLSFRNMLAPKAEEK
ncbi:MAG: helix-turn-helix transcriptional regulator [Clostridia bacterium]|nr:helix-turn-helix transcriptional regulator [Clostridia bacterium]